jgi:hypothetical protein
VERLKVESIPTSEWIFQVEVDGIEYLLELPEEVYKAYYIDYLIRTTSTSESVRI